MKERKKKKGRNIDLDPHTSPIGNERKNTSEYSEEPPDETATHLSILRKRWDERVLSLDVDTRMDTLPDTLHSQSGDQGSTNTTSILGGNHLDRIFPHRLVPTEDLTESVGATLLKVGVFVEDRTISTDVARLDILHLADSTDTAGGETRSAGTDQLSEAADEFTLGLSGIDLEFFLKQSMGFHQVLPRITVASRQTDIKCTCGLAYNYLSISARNDASREYSSCNALISSFLKRLTSGFA